MVLIERGEQLVSALVEAGSLELVEQVPDDRHVTFEGVAEAAHFAEPGAFLSCDIADAQVLADVDTLVGVDAESKEERFLCVRDLQGRIARGYFQG